ncbi:WYL domain-containing protein [Paenibacillus graminis]|uniref:WYL domain-containing protein n=1 Tax=Paenibacillus graminis TaxID=189425 RepID=UPI00398A9964
MALKACSSNRSKDKRDNSQAKCTVRGHMSERQVEPYQVVFKESSWYLQGY